MQEYVLQQIAQMHYSLEFQSCLYIYIYCEAKTWTLIFYSRGFIYIATVSVLPELLENSSFKQTVAEIVALLLGVYMMVIIAEYE